MCEKRRNSEKLAPPHSIEPAYVDKYLRWRDMFLGEDAVVQDKKDKFGCHH